MVEGKTKGKKTRNISSQFLYENIFKLELCLLQEAEALSRQELLENAEKIKVYISPNWLEKSGRNKKDRIYVKSLLGFCVFLNCYRVRVEKNLFKS